MFFDTDCGGVAHNLAYLRFIEVARVGLAESMGMSLKEMGETRHYPAVIRTEIDYKHPAFLGDSLLVRGWLESLERARFWYAFEIVRPVDGQCLANSRQMLALVQMPEAKPLRLPGSWREHFAGKKETDYWQNGE